MEKINTNIEWVYLLKCISFSDNRWDFRKFFNQESFQKEWLSNDFKESYFSVSHLNVIRWMHFQCPPFSHNKLVYLSQGNVIDIILDIRKWSKTYWNYIETHMNYNEWISIYIPKWIAHGFISLSANTIVNYLQDSSYSKEHDTWILYNSFGYKWNTSSQEVISERDLSFKQFNDFDSPFILWKNC
jgi:dTDP-4-dehydrorhamnose 3,5-epimerase